MDIEELSVLLRTIDIGAVTDEEFMLKANQAKSITPLLDPNNQLLLYGLFKHVVSGDCKLPEPLVKETEEHYKWQAWTSFNGFPKAEAMRAYVYFVNDYTEELAAGKASNNKSSTMPNTSPSISTLYVDYNNANNKMDEEASQWILPKHALIKQIVTEGALTADSLKEWLTVCSINEQDEEGRSALHYACDKGLAGVCSLLLEVEGINLNLQDTAGHTPLMYAILCEHKEIVSLLVSSSLPIDYSLCTTQGEESCLELAEQCAEEPASGKNIIMELLLEHMKQQVRR